MRADHLVKGQHAEKRARRYLESRGLTFVEANYHCRPGEIDLVMHEGDTIVFVEVRYRKDQRYGGAPESIDARKQRRLRAAAQHYLQRRLGTAEADCRIDVVFVTGTGESEVNVNWIPNAV